MSLPLSLSLSLPLSLCSSVWYVGEQEQPSLVEQPPVKAASSPTTTPVLCKQVHMGRGRSVCMYVWYDFTGVYMCLANHWYRCYAMKQDNS